MTVLWTTKRFAGANPLVVRAMYDAVHEALATINADKAAAADRYLALSGDKIGREDLLEVLADPHVQFNAVPMGVMAFAGFMRKTGALKAEPGAWTDVFLPVAQGLGGN